MKVVIEILILASVLCGFVELEEIKSNSTHFIPTKEWQEIKEGKSYSRKNL